jgi:hypothetical protein
MSQSNRSTGVFPLSLLRTLGEALAANPQPGCEIRKRHRDWMVINPQGERVCVTVYKRDAMDVVRRLSA